MAASRTSKSSFVANTSPQQQQRQQSQPDEVEMAGILLEFTHHFEESPPAAHIADDDDNNGGDGGALPASAASFSTLSSPATSSSSYSSSSPDENDDGENDDATNKICTRPRCPHNRLPLPLLNFQETNKRGEVTTWKHCKDCRTKHAKEDRERKQAKRKAARKAASKAMAGDDDEDGEDEDEDDDEDERPYMVVRLRAPAGALRVLAGGGNIGGEAAETFADGPTLVLRGRGGASSGDRIPSSASRKRVKDEDSSDGEWGLQQVQKRRKSVLKGGLGRTKKGSSKVAELGPEESVYDSGTNSEEERDKKRADRGAKGKKGGSSEYISG